MNNQTNMTPKEKAKELLKKAQDCQWADAEYGMDDITSKNIVLFAVDEIFNALSYKVSTNFEELKYFVKVKQEIEKL